MSPPSWQLYLIVHKVCHIICSAPVFISPKYLSNKSPPIFFFQLKFKVLFPCLNSIFVRFVNCYRLPQILVMWKDWVSHLKTWGAWSSEHFLFTPCFRVLECFVIFVNQPFQCFEILSLLDIELLSTLLFMRNSLSKYFVIVKGHLILYTFNNLQRCMLNFSYLYFFQILAY